MSYNVYKKYALSKSKSNPYTFKEIGINDISQGFKLVVESDELLSCCDGVRFNIAVANDLLNELKQEQDKIEKYLQDLYKFYYIANDFLACNLINQIMIDLGVKLK